MGGWGSGRQAYKYEYTVEDCLSIDISIMFRGKNVGPGWRSSGTLYWTVDGYRLGLISYDTCLSLKSPHMYLHYNWMPNKNSQSVFLTSTHPNYGGFRYWFLCPSCRRRVRKLYLTLCSKYFLCRHCQNLTYTSCRMSHELDTIIKRFVKEKGSSWNETKEAIMEIRKKYGGSEKPINLVGEC